MQSTGDRIEQIATNQGDIPDFESFGRTAFHPPSDFSNRKSRQPQPSHRFVTQQPDEKEAEPIHAPSTAPQDTGLY